MNINNNILKISFSLAVLLGSQASLAAGTTAGVDILNTATLTYSVGGQSQTPLSDSTTFIVDQKVDLLVSGMTEVGNNNILEVNPLTTSNSLVYQLDNEGNSAQDFKIELSHLSGANDEFDATSCQYTVVPAASPAGPYAFTDTPVVSLAEDASADITVTCSIPDISTDAPVVKDGSTSKVDVLATAVDGSGAVMTNTGDPLDGSDREGTMDVVLADDDAATTTDTAARNAMHSAVQTFEIDTPMLSVEKTSEVIYDPFNEAVNPKRIPGAIVEYTITVKNSSDSEATGVTVSDLLDISKVVFLSSTPVSPEPALPDTDGIANTGGGTEDYGTTAANTVTVTGITVPAGTDTTPAEVTVTFQVKIL